MFKHYFEGIQNIEIAPIISMVLFFTVFLLVVIWAIKIDKSYIDEMKNMPLDENRKQSDTFKRA